MEKLADSFNRKLDEIQQRREANRGKEYKYLWLRVSFALVRDEELRRITPNGLAVFISIRVYMDKEGIAYPSLSRIAYQTGLSVGTVQKVIKKLIRVGWIRREGRIESEDGTFGNTKYRILERDLFRGTAEDSFIDKPIANNDNGD